MLVLRARAAVTGRDKKRYSNAKAGWVVSVFSALLTDACAAPPPPRAPTAADAGVAVPAARYSSVTAPYARQRPVEPLPWREQNERVAPQAKP